MKEKRTIKHVKKKLKSMDVQKGSKTEILHMKTGTKIDKIKLGFLGWFTHTHEQACVRII